MLDLLFKNLHLIDFRGSNLIGADLIEADLTGARLNGAELTGADLTGARLDGANLHDAGVMIIPTLRWPVQIDVQYMRIGCKLHTHDEWRAFDDDTIDAMDASDALVFWQAWRDVLLSVCDKLATTYSG